MFVVVAHGYFSKQNGAASFFYCKIVIQVLLNRDAFSRAQFYLRPGRNGEIPPVFMDRDIRIRKALIRRRIIDADQYDSAASVNDVLHFRPVKMHRRALSFFQHQKLFCVRLWIGGIFQVAVADGN